MNIESTLVINRNAIESVDSFFFVVLDGLEEENSFSRKYLTIIYETK